MIGSRRSFHLRYSPEVQVAKTNRKPIVALESTIISHGMPYPQNLHVAQELEAIVRTAGAAPATIAVINNNPCIGLDADELLLLARDQKQVLKASTRDLSFVCSPSHGKARHAATTVASTMRLAQLAGISIFATGGLGGVHRGAEVSMDISADLIELGRTPVTVVCAGIKSILDVAKSLEVLETQGVPVIGFGTDSFPAFFTNDSGLKVPARVDNIFQAAEMIWTQQALQGREGMVIAVPNPHPANAQVIQSAIDNALMQAERMGIRGNAITPFLLEAIEKLTKGKSLESNIALVKNNVRVAAEIAVELGKLGTVSFPSSSSKRGVAAPQSSVSNEPANKVLVFGGAVVDIISSSSPPSQHGTSNPGIIHRGIGGVGRNVATNLAKKDISTAMITIVGEDEDGTSVVRDLQASGVDTALIARQPFRTARYNAIHDHTGDLVMGVADMDIFTALNAAFVNSNKDIMHAIDKAEVIVCDGNIKEGFNTIAKHCGRLQKPLFFEPTSVHKSASIMQEQILGCVSVVKPNLDELIAMLEAMQSDAKAKMKSIIDEIKQHQDNKELLMTESYGKVRQLAAALHHLMNHDRLKYWSSFVSNGQHVIVSLGEHGIIWCSDSKRIEASDGVDLARLISHQDGISTLHLPALPVKKDDIKHTNGAGDAFFAGVIQNSLSRNSEGKKEVVVMADLVAGLDAAKHHLTCQ